MIVDVWKTVNTKTDTMDCMNWTHMITKRMKTSYQQHPTCPKSEMQIFIVSTKHICLCGGGYILINAHMRTGNKPTRVTTTENSHNFWQASKARQYSMLRGIHLKYNSNIWGNTLLDRVRCETAQTTLNHIHKYVHIVRQ